MKKILFSMLIASSLMVHADVRYGAFGLENGDIDVDGDGFDVSAYQLSFLSSSGNVIFSTGVASGTVDDVYGYDLDFVSQGINLGYAFGLFDAIAIIPLGDNDDWRATLGFANADDIDSLSFGVAYKF